MENNLTPTEKKLLDAWQLLQQHSENGQNLPPDSSRLAFSDPEFLQREETRGIRMQLEMLKPELSLNQYQIDNTIVVYGSARVHSAETVEKILAQAQANNDTATLQQAAQLRQGARYYEDARQFARLVAQHSSGQPRNQHYYICTGGGPGIMEAANRGASEAGEPSIGLNITLPHEQCANPYVTPALSFKFQYFARRKMHFMMRAKAIVTFLAALAHWTNYLKYSPTYKPTKPTPSPSYSTAKHTGSSCYAGKCSSKQASLMLTTSTCFTTPTAPKMPGHTSPTFTA